MTTPAPAPSPGNSKNENVRHLSPIGRAAYARFEAGGDPAELVPVVISILEDYIPREPARPLSEMAGSTRLMEDLGFDSLAITEVVFFTEELLGITISNNEIIQVRTLDDLHVFIRGKVEGIKSR